MSTCFNENCTVAYNGSFSSRLNVSPCRLAHLSVPPRPLSHFAPIVTQWFYRAACCWKTRFSIKGGVFCVVSRRVSRQVSTWNTKVFSYLICMHSHNERTCLSCFQVRRVQTRLLFAPPSDTCTLLPPVQTLVASHRLCPGCMFSCLCFSSLSLCVEYVCFFLKKLLQLIIKHDCLFCVSFLLLCYICNTKSS